MGGGNCDVSSLNVWDVSSHGMDLEVVYKVTNYGEVDKLKGKLLDHFLKAHDL